MVEREVKMAKLSRKEIDKVIDVVIEIAAIAAKCIETHGDSKREPIPPRILIKPIEMKKKARKT